MASAPENQVLLGPLGPEDSLISISLEKRENFGNHFSTHETSDGSKDCEIPLNPSVIDEIFGRFRY